VAAVLNLGVDSTVQLSKGSFLSTRSDVIGEMRCWERSQDWPSCITSCNQIICLLSEWVW
jgi:hypothetical protein